MGAFNCQETAAGLPVLQIPQRPFPCTVRPRTVRPRIVFPNLSELRSETLPTRRGPGGAGPATLKPNPSTAVLSTLPYENGSSRTVRHPSSMMILPAPRLAPFSAS